MKRSATNSIHTVTKNACPPVNKKGEFL